MWRKQDEAKASPSSSTSSPEANVQTKVEPTAPIAPAPSPVPTVTAYSPILSAASTPAGYLTSSLRIKGEITGREDFYIDGEVQGKVRLEDGRVTIGPNGRVTADVDAREIVVRGQVKGNLHARDRVEIGQTGRATGDVITRRISIDEGAELRGHVEILKAEEPKPARVTPAVSAVQAPAPAPAAVAVAAKVEAKESPTTA